MQNPPPHCLLNQLTYITNKIIVLKKYSYLCLSMITYVTDFTLIISTDATSSSILNNVFFDISILKIETCLTITKIIKSDAKKFYLSLLWL